MDISGSGAKLGFPYFPRFNFSFKIDGNSGVELQVKARRVIKTER